MAPADFFSERADNLTNEYNGPEQHDDQNKQLIAKRRLRWSETSEKNGSCPLMGQATEDKYPRSILIFRESCPTLAYKKMQSPFIATTYLHSFTVGGSFYAKFFGFSTNFR